MRHAALGQLEDDLLDAATGRFRKVGFEEVKNFGHQDSLTKRYVRCSRVERQTHRAAI
jgi:hypothetical protein